MTDKLYLKSKKFFRYWYPIFTMICILNLLIHLLLPINNRDYDFIWLFLLPFVHCGCIWIYMFYVMINERKEKGYNYQSRSHVDNLFSLEEKSYILTNHSEIYSKIVPYGFKVNFFALAKFRNGDYDDGSDEKLVIIRNKMKFILFVPLYAFFLIPVAWFLGIFVIIFRGF